MRAIKSLALSITAVALLATVGGCAGRPALIPVSDPDLKKTSAEFAADAAKRSYPASAPKAGEAQARAEIDHGMFNRIRALNTSDQDWNDVEMWVNEKYVVFLAHWKAHDLKKVNFQMLYDRDGKSFPVDNKEFQVQKIEILRDGKLYILPSKLAD